MGLLGCARAQAADARVDPATSWIASRLDAATSRFQPRAARPRGPRRLRLTSASRASGRRCAGSTVRAPQSVRLACRARPRPRARSCSRAHCHGRTRSPNSRSRHPPLPGGATNTPATALGTNCRRRRFRGSRRRAPDLRTRRDRRTRPTRDALDTPTRDAASDRPTATTSPNRRARPDRDRVAANRTGEPGIAIVELVTELGGR